MLTVCCAFLLLGDLAWSLKERAVQELAKAQLREFSQDPLLLNLLFGALPAVLALLIAPAIGAWSDRTRTRLGRRIPFLLAVTPLLSASLAALAFSQPLAAWTLRLAGGGPATAAKASVAWMAICWALFDVCSIVSNVLFIALVNDTVPPERLGRFFGLFRIVSLAVGAAFFYFLFGDAAPGMNTTTMLAIAAVFLVVFLVVCAGVREPAYPPPGPRASARRAAGGAHLLLFLTLGLAAACVLPVNVNAYNAMGQFGAVRAQFGHAVAVTYCISILLAWPLGWLADRVHPLRIGLATLALYALSMLGARFFLDGPGAFLAVLVLHGVLAGSFLTGTASLLPRMLPRERFSELAAVSAAASALLAMVVSVALGTILLRSGSDYRLIFPAGGAIAAAATLGCAFLWRATRRKTGI